MENLNLQKRLRQVKVSLAFELALIQEGASDFIVMKAMRDYIPYQAKDLEIQIHHPLHHPFDSPEHENEVRRYLKWDKENHTKFLLVYKGGVIGFKSHYFSVNNLFATRYYEADLFESVEAMAKAYIEEAIKESLNSPNY